MAVTYGFFDSRNGDRKYNADQMSEYFRGIVSGGVFQHLDGGLQVTAGTGLSVNVAAGRAIVQNRWIQNSASLPLSISAASETYGRKDAVVLRLDSSARTVSITVKTGTPAASPAAPSMTRSGGVYEMALAYVNVAAGATSVTVTDKRSDSSVCGWAAVAQAASGEVDQMLNDMKTGFDGVVYSSPAAMVQGEDQKIIDKLTHSANEILMQNITFPLSATDHGIEWSLDSKGYFTASGTTTTSESVFSVKNNVISFMPAGSEYYIYMESNSNLVAFQVVTNNGSAISVPFSQSNTGVLTIPNDATSCLVRMQIPAGMSNVSCSGRIGVFRKKDIDNNIITDLNDKKNTIGLIQEHFAPQNGQKIAYSEMEFVKRGKVNASGVIDTGSCLHSVYKMSGAGVSRIRISNNSSSNVLMGIIAYDNHTKFVPFYSEATIQMIIPEGLPADAVLYFNWYYANTSNPTQICDGVYLTYADNDSRILTGKNKFDKNTAVAQCGCYYENGYYTDIGMSNYSVNAFPVNPGDTMRIAGNNIVSHVVFMDRYGKYVSGGLGQNMAQSTVPAGAYICTISANTAAISNFIVTLNESDTSYEDFYYYIPKPGAGTGGGGYQPYQTGYIYHTFETQQKPVFDGTTYNNTGYLKLPTTYSETGKPTPFVVIVHGASAGISSTSGGWTRDTAYNRIVDALTGAGYAVMDCNGFNDASTPGHDHWGCPQALAGYVQAYNYWVKTYNLDKLAFVYGFSMGGLTALSLMKGRMIPMRCAMIGAPVISIYNQCVERPSTPNPNFFSAYGITEYDRTKLYGGDRYLDIVQIGQTKYAFPPIPPLYIAYGESDVNISNEKILEYYDALYNANKIVRIKSYTGGHEISYGGNADVITDMVNWFNAYKG